MSCLLIQKPIKSSFFVTVFAFLFLNSCAAVNYDKGLAVAPEDTTIKDFEKTTSPNVIRHIDPPFHLGIDNSMKSRTWLFGIVVPVIPWIPGILQSIAKRKSDEIEKKALTVDLSFSHVKRVPVTYAFSLQNVELLVGNKRYFVAQSQCLNNSEKISCTKNDDNYVITVSTSAQATQVVSLSFNVLASDVKQGMLNIKSFTYNGFPSKISPVLIRPVRYISCDTVP